MKLSGKGPLNSYPYCKLIIFFLCSVYFIIPFFLQYLVGDNFYIYSRYQNKTIIPTIYFFVFLIISIIVIIYDLKWHNRIIFNQLSPRSYKYIIYITLIYLCYVIIRDLPLKLGGASRNVMLEAISSQLFPGFGFFLLLCMISIIQLHENKYLIYFCIVCFIVDFVHEGKIFVSYALLCSMFYFDDNKIKISFKRIVLIGTSGACFLLLIFFMRAIAVGDNPLLGIYSFFSEFMGVNATSGWAIEYSHANLPKDFFDFDTTLRSFYVNSVGHGLALSPVAYFLGNFEGGYYLVVIFYFILFTCLAFVGNRLIGKYCLLVILYNFIHLLRHGPNLFLSKCFFQIIFITLFFIWLNNVEYKLKSN